MAIGVKRPETRDELVDHRCELGDIGAVPGVSKGDEGDTAICRDDYSESTDAQVASLLLGAATLSDRNPLVARGNPGSKFCHVENEAREIDSESFDHFRHDTALDLFELGLADLVYCVPKAPMVERTCSKAQPPVTSGLVPPVRQGELGAAINHPVECRQGYLGHNRGPCVGPARADDLVDDLGHSKTPEHLEGRGNIAEGKVATAVRLAGARLRQTGRDLSAHSKEDLDPFARSLNNRPRETLGFMKPSENVAELVALTG